MPPPGDERAIPIDFRFGLTPTAILGERQAYAVRFTDLRGEEVELEADTVITAIGAHSPHSDWPESFHRVGWAAGAGGSMFGALGGVAKNYALDQLKGMAQEKIMGALMPKPKQPAPVTPSYGLAGPSRLGPAIEPPAAQPYQGLGWAPRKSNNPFTALAATLRNRAG